MHPQFQGIKKAGIACTICLTLASCAIPTAPSREDLHQQALAELKFPAKWQHSQSTGEFDAAALGFTLPSEVLALIAEAQRNNPDLRLAALRIEQSHSAVKAAGAALLPSLAIGGQGGESAIPTSSMAMNGLALIAQWEIDVWGKTRSGQAAAREQSVAAELDTLYARQSIAAAIVKAWLSATEATQQIRLAQEMVQLAEQQLALIQTGQKVGRNTQQDVLLNQLAVKNYRAQLLQSQQALNHSQRALEVLIGRYPAAEITVASALPAEPSPIPAGLPSALAERRPDLKAAESRFRAAFFNVEVAKKAYLPTISLTGGLGVADNQLFKLQDDLNNPIWGITGKFLAPIFTAGLIDAQVEIKTAQQQEATVQYAKAMLNALNEIEGGLYAEQKLAERYQLLKGQVNDQQKLIGLQKVQIKVGKSDYYQLYQQQLSLASYQFNLLRLQNERLIQRVNLHLALGGVYPI
ncbi:MULTISPECIES: TolC family protein [Deefgea]|uniref:Efflux transporter outer membrane subunit n=1 Tax=Deefgea chitinilytica TaxID=570276 RepID=A0ABS2CGR5_9NEIS|nr:MULTISPECIES: efflux transporter outer membrane subunit [Deefgea]MBM5572633.1 efflux transporter outer membrane subunit [Deefgea chitinilytica]MBM9889869.1 efflux transporter outer membrane subunit [Deefgea sp. CFH1-16]